MKSTPIRLAELAVPHQLLPRCERCGKMVEAATWTKMYDRREVLLVLRCHGEEEETTFSYDDLENSYLSMPGTAFAPKSGHTKEEGHDGSRAEEVSEEAGRRLHEGLY